MNGSTHRNDQGGGELDEAFALLGNETRMAILRALWDEREPSAPEAENALSFSALRERVGADDPGQFNYHLKQLVDEFVRRTDHGYVLRMNAVQVLRAALVRSEVADLVLAPTPADDPCPFCGATVEVAYTDEFLDIRCPVCPPEPLPGVLAGGTLLNSPIFPPTGIADRTGQQLWEALFDHVASAAFGFLRGVCPVCTARPTVTVAACADHPSTGRCDRCGSTQAAIATVQCGTCTFAWRGPAWVTATTHPAVVSFFADHDVPADGGLTLSVYRELLPSPETVRSTEPLLVEKSLRLDDEQLAVTVDGDLRVRDVTRT